MATQAQIIRQALRQAKGMKNNQRAYLKGASYKGRPVMIERSTDHFINVAHAGSSGGSVVSHTVETNGKVHHTERSASASSYPEIYGVKRTIKLAGRGGGAAKKASSGHSGG